MDRLGQVPDERARQFLDTADGNPFLAGQIIESLGRSVGLDPVPAQFTATVARRLPHADRARLAAWSTWWLWLSARCRSGIWACYSVTTSTSTSSRP